MSEFENLNRVSDKFRELVQRWDNRLILEGLSFPEAYVTGRIAIALIMDVRGGPETERAPRFASGAPNGIDGAGRNRGRVIFVFLADHHDPVMGRGDGSNDKTMLVGTVEVVQTPEIRIPIVSHVRLYDVSDYAGCVWRDSLYKSVVSGLYERIPRVAQREMKTIYGGDSSLDYWEARRGGTDDLEGSMVESAPKAMHSIAYSEAHDIEKMRLSVDDNRDRLKVGMRLLVSKCRIDISFDEVSQPALKIIDVLVGPFDL